MHRRLLCTSTALICLLGQTAFARNIFITPGDPQSTQLATVNGEPFSFGATVSTVPGAIAVLPSPNAQKYYVIGSSDQVGVLTGRFPNVSDGGRIAVGTAVTAADLTPDGRRLVVAGPNGTAIVDTSTDRVILAAGGLDTGSTPIDVAAGVDSRYVYVLSAASARLTSIDLNSGNGAVARTAQVPSTATSVVVSPGGLVYVSASNQIYELDPTTLALRATINLNGAADALQFTPNGRYAFARNLQSFSGRSLIGIDLQTRRTLETPTSAAFSGFTLVSNELGYGVLPGGNLVEVRIASDGVVTQVTPNITSGTLPSSISDIVPSGELPASRALIIVSGGNAYRLDLTTRELFGPIATSMQGSVSVVPPLSTSSVQNVLPFNTTQTVAAGTTSLPLTLLAYDANGLPTSGANVTFSTSTPGVTFSSASGTTNMMGIAATTVAVPAGASGTIPITATLGARTINFTITVGDPGLPGGNPGTGTNRFTIVSGQGAVVRAGLSTSQDAEPLRVRYIAPDGSALANLPITWTIVEGNGTLLRENNGITDGDGVSTVNISTGILPNAGFPYQRIGIQATAPDGQTHLFYIVAVRISQGRGGLQVAANPVNNSEIRAQAGQTLPNAFTYSVRSVLDGVAIPSVGLRAQTTNTDPTLGPVAECRGGTVFSDAQGNIVCDLVVTGRPGSSNMRVFVGGGANIFDYQLVVVVGSPSVMRILSGNNQSANPGQQLSPLVVEVQDAGGNVLPNVGVSWNIPPNAGVLSVQNTTDFAGRASATISLPNAAGSYNITATSGTATATFRVTANAVAGNLSIAGGDGQSALVGQQFGQAVQVRVVDNSGAPVSGVPVSFAVISGSASVGSSSTTTNAQGFASTTVTAGSTPGSIVVRATAGNFSVNFNLTSRLAGPVFTAESIVNGASFQPGISPGSIAYIRVAGIAPDLRGSVTPANIVGPLPTTLAGVQVSIGGTPAPIFSVSNINGQESLAVQVPFEVPVGTTSVTVTAPGGGSTTANGVLVSAVSPGVFTWTDPVNNSTVAVAVRPDGSFASSTNPVRRGEIIRIYATGLGQTTPATATNRVGVTGQSVAAQLVVGVNNAGTRLVSAELMPGTVGVYVVALEIPADTPTGANQPIGLAVIRPDGGAEFANSVFIPIQ